MSRYLAAWYAAEKLGPGWLPLDVPDTDDHPMGEHMRNAADAGPQGWDADPIIQSIYPQETRHADQ